MEENTFVGIPVDAILDSLRKQEWEISRELFHTPKWRKVKRYRLLELKQKLAEEIDLIDHVLNDN
jgi:hypothetical protein